MSGLVNVLSLTGAFFMLEVYDRVIPSRSIPTLIGLLAFALILYIFHGAVEAIRSRILSRVGSALNESLGTRLLELVLRAPLEGGGETNGLQPLRDLDQIRAFLSGTGVPALFDLPWMPVYIAVCSLFHPLIGLAALAGAIVLAALALVSDRKTKTAAKSVIEHGMACNALAETGRRNAEVLSVLGMQDQLVARWGVSNQEYMAAHRRVADTSSGLGSISKLFRIALQSGVLALGAWLVIGNMATAGVITAASILVARAMAPAELAIANWKGFVQARQSWERLSDLLKRAPIEVALDILPAPCRALVVERISVTPPGAGRPVVQDVNFTLEAGQGLGVIGPSGSGKSSLIRVIVGVWPAMRGAIRLDGAALDQWPRRALGLHLGYLPQDAELFAGTVAENISRFERNAPAETIVAAAHAAGIHDLILRLPQGYATRIADGGVGLSSGQRQRIGLARALYRDPFLVVLDEPNANLDVEGENALTHAIRGVRARGGICVVVAHRPSALDAIDRVLILGDGRVQAFGPRDAVLKRVMRPTGMPAREAAPGSNTTLTAPVASVEEVE
jgi:ATP-binding cassette subfamily C protein